MSIGPRVGGFNSLEPSDRERCRRVLLPITIIGENKMAEMSEKRGRGRPRKPRELLKILGTINSTREKQRVRLVREALLQPRPEPSPELAPWRMTFECGYDFFSDLCDIGLDGDAIDDAKVRKLAREAWKRLGAEFLRTREPENYPERPPWAMRQWGERPEINGAELAGESAAGSKVR
jgi:hypothetical protein